MQHIKSRRHRRFALNDDHFTDLDKVLARLDRQVLGRPRLPQYDRLHLDEPTDEDEDEEDDYASVSSSGGEEEGEELDRTLRDSVEEEEDELELDVDPETCQHEWELVDDDEMDGDEDTGDDA